MKGLRVPGWLAAGVLDRYHAGASHLFLLHGNVRDVHPFGASYLPLADALRKLADRRPIVASFDVSAGLSCPDSARSDPPALTAPVAATMTAPGAIPLSGLAPSGFAAEFGAASASGGFTSPASRGWSIS